jgi:hypothetical protein
MTIQRIYFSRGENQPLGEYGSIRFEGGDEWAAYEWPSRMGGAHHGVADVMTLELRSSANDLKATVPLEGDIANVVPRIDEEMERHGAMVAVLIVKFRD